MRIRAHGVRYTQARAFEKEKRGALPRPADSPGYLENRGGVDRGQPRIRLRAWVTQSWMRSAMR